MLKSPCQGYFNILMTYVYLLLFFVVTDRLLPFPMQKYCAKYESKLQDFRVPYNFSTLLSFIILNSTPLPLACLFSFHQPKNPKFYNFTKFQHYFNQLTNYYRRLRIEASFLKTPLCNRPSGI